VFGASPWGTGDWTDGNRCWSCLSVNGAAGRRRRQAKRYGDQVTIDKLIERDGHAPCHLCDESIHYEDRGGSWGPSVDHLVPLSEGGDDTLENTALAHKWCNSVRNTRPIAEVRALLTQ
jgi:5-methylcytosine-specific restriction endonuclease McrA